jgi:pimeloyl-ACP methyl ester carboxylesterase
MPFFNSSGVRIHFEVAGDGQPVLLVHGLTSNIEWNWRRPGIIGALVEAGLCAIGLDTRGHGRSDKPVESGAYSITRMGDDVLALMDHLGVAVADLAGYSMGGAIAASLLCRSPDRLRRVIIAGIGDSVFGPDAGIPRVIPRRGRLSGRGLAALAALRNAERTPIDVERLSEVTCPVLILTGSGDRVAGSSRRLAATMRGAKSVRVPGNHFTAVAHPAFRQAMIEFLTSREVR